MGVLPQFHLPHMVKFRHTSALGMHMPRFHRHPKQPVRGMVPLEEPVHHKERISKTKLRHLHRHHRAAGRTGQHHDKLPSVHKTKSTHLHGHHKQPVCAEVLPEEAQRLKDKILRTHKVKSTHFSLSYMKTVVVPPVHIPRELNNQRALCTTVAGRNVPLTRCMWDNSMRKLHHMEPIPEFSAALYALPTKTR
ncbi:hypothetical protein PsorP6_003220 [Peronosclerospora sorghi]|uniref:Uncharacterized protein n=1 Tax=Peronosclerospora sorghi TaxID=230839 RepID=A0ACC0VPM5_9STRA|nr:hypothetical protein PsorP6_003220 [Peronosclerospora sorghi]